MLIRQYASYRPQLLLLLLLLMNIINFVTHRQGKRNLQWLAMSPHRSYEMHRQRF